MRDTLIKKINIAEWWHVPPSDSDSYKKRGKFLASTFLQAEFYGRPGDIPERISIKNPVFGFSEFEILEQLFDSAKAKQYLNNISEDQRDFYRKRIALDARMHRRAKALGYDAVVLMTPNGRRELLRNRKPNFIELNLIIE